MSPEGRALVHSGEVMNVTTFTGSVQVSGVRCQQPNSNRWMGIAHEKSDMREPFALLKCLKGIEDTIMVRKTDDIEANQAFLAELEAQRTGEAVPDPDSDGSGDPSIDRVREDLARLAKIFEQVRPEPSDIPEAVDAAVLDRIQHRCREIQRRKRIARLFFQPKWAAAAAALLLLIGWYLIIHHNEPMNLATEKSSVAVPSAIAQDIDGNGAVDIVDAYLMAKAVNSGRKVPIQWDFNGDGIVDAGDIRTVARTAVTLNGGNA